MTDGDTPRDGPGARARRTDEERTDDRRTDWKRTLADVDHEHPHDGWQRSWRLFGRGTTVAADGGRRPGPPADDGGRTASRPDRPADDASARGPAAEEPPRPGTLADVDHTPPSPDDEGAIRVWLRGLKRRLDRGV